MELELLPDRSTPGIVDVLVDCLIDSRRSRSQTATVRARLSRDTIHHAQEWGWGWRWSCAYQSVLSVIHSLHSDPDYKSVFDKEKHGADPSVRRIQGWIEQAWADGYYDPQCTPRQCLNRSPNFGMTHWDVWAMMTWLSVE